MVTTMMAESLSQFLLFLGNCITSIDREDVCELNSTAINCVNDTLTARNCLCEKGFSGSRACYLAGISVSN